MYPKCSNLDSCSSSTFALFIGETNPISWSLSYFHGVSHSLRLLLLISSISLLINPLVPLYLSAAGQMNSQITEFWWIRVKVQTNTQAILAAMIEIKWNFSVIYCIFIKKCCLSLCLPWLCHLALSERVHLRLAIMIGGLVWSQWTGSYADCCWIINPIRCESDTSEWFYF